jgi:O-antigen/teichoic acid export membrane protein
MLLRSTLLYLPAQIIGPLFQLVSVVVWTHIVGESTLGIITLVTATHELLQAVFLLWWSQYTLRFFGTIQDGEQADRFYRTENAVLLLSIAVQGMFALIVLHTKIAPEAGLGLSLAVLAYVAGRSFNIYIGERARVRGEILVYSIQQMTGPALGFLLGLLLLRMFGEGAEWPIAGYAAAQLAAVLAALPLIRFGWAVWPVDRAILNQALHYGLPLVVGGGLSWVTISASRFIVSDMLGVAAAGLFAVGYGLGFRSAMVPAMMVTASAYPLAVRTMVEQGAKSAMNQLSLNGALLAAVLFPSVAGVFMLRDEIVHLLIAVSFQPATLSILPAAALAGAIRNFRAHFVDQTFLLHRRTKILVGINAIEAALTVSTCVLFISWWGLDGAVVASVAATAAAAVLSFSIGILFLGLRPPLVHLAKISASTAIMAAVLYELPKSATAFSLASHIVFGGAVYALALAALYGASLMRMRNALRPSPVQAREEAATVIAGRREKHSQA